MNAPLWDIVNPSDAYTIRSDDYEAIAFTALLLGGGQYPVREIDGYREVPFFMFGGIEEWWQKTFGHDVPTMKDDFALMARVIDVLKSVQIGDKNSRVDFEAACGAIEDEKKRADYIAKYHDRHRSSMNDIGGRAKQIAEQLEKKIAGQDAGQDAGKLPKAPTSVFVE